MDSKQVLREKLRVHKKRGGEICQEPLDRLKLPLIALKKKKCKRRQRKRQIVLKQHHIFSCNFIFLTAEIFAGKNLSE